MCSAALHLPLRLTLSRRFRWVSCQIDEPCKLPTDKTRRQALLHLPPSLNATHERILERVNDTSNQLRSVVQKTLLWTAFADPPLTIAELCEAIAIGDGSVAGDAVSLDPEDSVDEREIAFCCGSLIRKIQRRQALPICTLYCPRVSRDTRYRTAAAASLSTIGVKSDIFTGDRRAAVPLCCPVCANAEGGRQRAPVREQTEQGAPVLRVCDHVLA